MNKMKIIKSTGFILLFCILLVLPIVSGIYWTHVLILTAFNVILAVSLRAFMRIGQMSLGTAGFLLVGAYSSALLTKLFGFSFWVTLPIAGLLASGITLLVGYPFLKAKGLFFAILTFLLAEGLRLIAWYWSDLTGGSGGLKGISPPDPISLFGLITISFDNKIAYYYLVIVILIIILLILYRLEKSWFGLMWQSIKESDDLAQSIGINTMAHKIMIFSIYSFFAGITGALYAHYTLALSPYGTPGAMFSMVNSMYILIYVVVGGGASFAGPIIGSILLTIIPEAVRGLKEFMPMLFGGVLILITFLLPDGLVSLPSVLASAFRKNIAHRNKKPVEG